MITHRSPIIAALAVGTVALCATTAMALTFTCSTVDRQDLFDPDMERFSSKFESPDINSSGDTVFVSRTKCGERKLYLYPGAGGETVVAREGDAAPGGSTFERFEDSSINDAGDLGVSASLAAGQGVFVQPSGGAVLAAARTGDPSPGGGTFQSFSQVSDVNDSGDIAFIATVTGGPGGVFVYDRSAATVLPVALVGGSTGGGRTFCSFINVANGGSRVAFQAVTETTCGVSNDAQTAIFQRDGATFTVVATQGGPSAIAGATVAKLFDISSNTSDDVGYRAKITGSAAGTAVFLFTPGGGTTTLVKTGDAAPRSGGSIKTIPHLGGITNTDTVAFRGKISGGGARHGVFLFDGGDDAAVLTSDAVPTDLWGTAASYRNIDEDTGVSSSGGWVTYVAKIRDRQTPSGTGVFRCHGS